MRFTIFLSFVLSTFLSFAQITTPQPSPFGTVEQKVGLTDIAINYSRPSVKERVIFGELVPFNEMWRTGANGSSRISFSTDVIIQGQDVPAGEYALYTIPGESEWTIILYKDLSFWGTPDEDYKAEDEQLRFNVVSDSDYPTHIETFTMNVSDVSSQGCNVEFLWETTQVKFSIGVSYDEIVMKQIEAAMTVSSRTYYVAARYYLENDKDLDQALEWINIALEDEEKFWIVRRKALILAKQGKYTEAIAVAERSKELALEAENDHYVKLNDDSIAEWKNK